MNALQVVVLSPILPWPLNMGAKIRIFYVLQELARAGHEVTLFALAHEPYRPEDLEALRPYCAELDVVPVKKRSRLRTALKALFSLMPYRVAKFESREFAQKVAQALRRDYDVLWVHFVETLGYVPAYSLERQRSLVVLDQHNADERFWETFVRQGPPWVRLFAWQNIKKLRRLQRMVIQWVDLILSVSEEDAKFTRAQLSNSHAEVWVVPNGVDIEAVQPLNNTNRRNRVLFCGALDVLMNIDGVEWVARRVFPKVRKVVPDAEFWIVGRDPAPRVKALGSLPGVHVTGPVEDVRPYYAEAKVASAPFRYGGGTKLKVLEAMALGVPVVATLVGCQGIEAVPGKHLFVEKDEEAFAQRIIALLRDEFLRREIAAEARILVESCYSWHSIMNAAIVRLEHLLEKPR